MPSAHNQFSETVAKSATIKDYVGNPYNPTSGFKIVNGLRKRTKRIGKLF